MLIKCLKLIFRLDSCKKSSDNYQFTEKCLVYPQYRYIYMLLFYLHEFCSADDTFVYLWRPTEHTLYYLYLGISALVVHMCMLKCVAVTTYMIPTAVFILCEVS